MLYSEEQMIRDKINFLDEMLSQPGYNPKAEVDVL